MSERVQVGDRLIWRATQARYTQDSEVVVTRVGRKWAYGKAAGYREVKFDAETGFEDSGQYMSNHRALTPEQDVEEKRRAGLVVALRDRGIELGLVRGREITTDQLQRIADVLAN